MCHCDYTLTIKGITKSIKDMDYNRLVIDTVKQALVSYVSTGTLPTDEINKTILILEIGVDNATTENKDTTDLVALISDLEDIKRVCYENPINIGVTIRFYEAVNFLIENGKIRGKQTYCNLAGIDKRAYYRQESDNEASLIQFFWIIPLVTEFNINAKWLLTGKGGMFEKRV